MSRTYKQFEGFHPIFSYIGREGKQHCQNGTPAYLERSIALLDQLAVKFPKLFRLDGGNDLKDTLSIQSR